LAGAIHICFLSQIRSDGIKIDLRGFTIVDRLSLCDRVLAGVLMDRIRLPLILLTLALLASCGSTTSSATPAPTQTDAPATAASQPATSAPAATAPADTSGEDGAAPKIALKLISDALDRPIYVTHAGDDRLFVVEKVGKIVILRNNQPSAEPFLDISERVGASGSEQGLLSVAFHPQFAQNGYLYVNYTNRSGDTVISRFQANGDSADPGSEAVLLEIDQPYPNHNGGLAMFGPDGYLYIGMGDGGSGGDPQGHGQNLKSLLGKLLRLDVDKGDPYGTPPDNPWPSGDQARPEVWAYGLRNPWRFSFDRTTGDLYIADVGQNQYEEIDFQPADSRGGENYGWNKMEGQHCFRANSCDNAGLVMPIAEYDHSLGCSVTGGYVYRGAAFPRLQGLYFYGDYCSGRVWALAQPSPGRWEQHELLRSSSRISSFGEDQAGELYLTDLNGGLYQVVEG
jgi:glucose/arabinose dehydrogenase